ncbi:hypothetical protein CW354_03565 [Marinicaulis flavus]|uniref:Uncharacterized protein n=2 Tax=Hyphococcus luteus TaxID=2058213 RepID=A0A2S7K9A9_9PROT|nr:hypothetical protein CW354_03565 [Marinicaulis flavus]
MFALSGCAQQASSPGADAPSGEEPAMPDNGDCPVIDSRDWKAWVNAMPGPGAETTLIVEGAVDMPTPGYTFSWEAGMADRSAVPAQRLHLTATAPDGMVTQVITTENVRYEGPAIAKEYRAAAVMCGDELLAEITDVVTAE